jgi:hypothetical protein
VSQESSAFRSRRKSRDAGYRLAWQRLDRERNIDAARASHRGDNSPLRALLDELLEPLA